MTQITSWTKGGQIVKLKNMSWMGIGILLAAAEKLHAHHYDVAGMSIPHEVMFVPAALVAAVGSMLFFGWGLKRRKGAGMGIVLASLPLWFIALA